MWIVRINNYYNKWYSIHYQRLKSYGLDVNSYYKWILNSDAMQINLKGQKFWDTTCWNSRKARTKDSREENGKAYSIKHVDPTFPIQYIEFWISRQPAHSTIEGSVQLFCWYYRVESTGEKHKSHLSPDIRWIYQNFFLCRWYEPNHRRCSAPQTFSFKIVGTQQRKWLWCGSTLKWYMFAYLLYFACFCYAFQDGEKVKCEKKYLGSSTLVHFKIWYSCQH